MFSLRTRAVPAPCSSLSVPGSLKRLSSNSRLSPEATQNSPDDSRSVLETVGEELGRWVEVRFVSSGCGFNGLNDLCSPTSIWIGRTVCLSLLILVAATTFLSYSMCRPYSLCSLRSRVRSPVCASHAGSQWRACSRGSVAGPTPSYYQKIWVIELHGLFVVNIYTHFN